MWSKTVLQKLDFMCFVTVQTTTEQSGKIRFLAGSLRKAKKASEGFGTGRMRFKKGGIKRKAQGVVHLCHVGKWAWASSWNPLELITALC